MSGRSDDDELVDLLRDLERDLDRLTDRLDADDAAAVRPRNRNQDRDRDRNSSRRRAPGRRQSERGPRAPSPGDLLRFTEEYTIPTVISVLEATVQSLELLRGGLRLADPTRRADDAGRSGDGERNRVGVRGRVARELGGGASVAVERTLSDLRTALSAVDLPENEGEDGGAREILEDARAITDEIERRLDASEPARGAGRDDADADRFDRTDPRHSSEDRTRREGEVPDRRRNRDRRRGSARRGVGIAVRDADDDRDADGESGASGDSTEAETTDEADDDAPQVDVDAELESIRREVGDERDTDANGGADADADEAEGPENDGSDGSDETGT